MEFINLRKEKTRESIIVPHFINFEIYNFHATNNKMIDKF